MTGRGGVLPAPMTKVPVPIAPPPSVARRATVTLSGVVYVHWVVGPVASSNAPSPSRSHAYVSGVCSGSDDRVASKSTVSGVAPYVRDARITAVGRRLAGAGEMRRIVPP